jgi:hypothetical protein
MTEAKALIVVRAAENYEAEMACNGCRNLTATHVLEVGSIFGKGTTATLYRMCDGCLRLLKVAVLDRATSVSAQCRCPCDDCIDSTHQVSP